MCACKKDGLGIQGEAVNLARFKTEEQACLTIDLADNTVRAGHLADYTVCHDSFGTGRPSSPAVVK